MTTPEILLIEDTPDDAFLIRRVIDKHLPGRFQVSHQTTMGGTETYIKDHKEDISLILLDLGLPDTRDGRDSFEHVKKYASEIPIVILTGLEDHDLALSLVREGAEDFVNKNLLREKPELLRDVVEFASCRHQMLGDTHKKYKDSIKDKEEIISWMSGDYSVKN